MGYIELFDGPTIGCKIFPEASDIDRVITGTSADNVALQVSTLIGSLGAGRVVLGTSAQQALVPGAAGATTVLDYAHVVYRDKRVY